MLFGNPVIEIIHPYFLFLLFCFQLGIFLVLMIHPGDPKLSSGQVTMETEKISAMDTILDLIRCCAYSLQQTIQFFGVSLYFFQFSTWIENLETIQSLLFRNMFPDNLVQASFERTRTMYKKSLTNQVNGTAEQISKEVAEQRGMNILGKCFFTTFDEDSLLHCIIYIYFPLIIFFTGIIVFCIGFGIVTSHYAEKLPVMVNFFLALDKIIMRLMLSVMW